MFKFIKKAIKVSLPYGIVCLINQQKADKQAKHKRILKILSRDYSDIISNYKYRCDPPVEIQLPYPVWVCWWQGEAGMPEIVKICYSRLLAKANGHKVNLITKDNFKDFVTLPDYILEKADKGFISLTHLSDILRVELLSKYGGLWIDATVYTLRDLPAFDTDLFSVRRLRDCNGVSECRWTGYLLYAGGGTRLLFNFVKSIFFEYWKKNNKLLVYLFIDYCIALAHKNIPAITTLINDIPFSNPHIFWLRENINCKYNELSFSVLMDSGHFCKLTRKQEFKEVTEEGELTYYGYIKSIA